MALPITTSDLITEVRDLIDERNIESVSDPKILRALNRGARNAYMIIAKQYDQIYLASSPFTSDGTAYVDIPEDAFNRRVEYLTYDYNTSNNSTQNRLEKVHPRKAFQYSYNTSSKYPVAYTTEKERIKLLPSPPAGVTGDIWYMKKPATLVESQGRVVDVSGLTITVDALGSTLSTDVDTLGAFVNIVDPETGLAKVSMQITSIDTTNKIITFTASPIRTTVYNTTIGTALPSDITIDDYVCGIGGTCVMEIISDHSDYLTQYAVVAIKRSLRLPVDSDLGALSAMEKQIETIWSGRENDHTVSRKNPHWQTTRPKYRR